jgi:hypothetical protein
MKRILQSFYNEPTVVLLTANAAVAALAAEGVIAGWISVVVIAATAPILRHFVEPVRRSGR